MIWTIRWAVSSNRFNQLCAETYPHYYALKLRLILVFKSSVRNYEMVSDDLVYSIEYVDSDIDIGKGEG